MRNFNKEEYLALVMRLADQRYEELEETELERVVWIPAEPEIKEKLLKIRSDVITDLTNVKKNQLLNNVFKSNNLKIDNFTIKIIRYHGNPDEKDAHLTIDFTLYHEVYETPNMKAPCRMTLPCNIYKDTRFLNAPWLKYFDRPTGSHATKVPTESLMDIIRWIQVATKYTAFL